MITHDHVFRVPVQRRDKTYYEEWSVVIDDQDSPNVIAHQRTCRICGHVESVPYTGGLVGVPA